MRITEIAKPLVTHILSESLVEGKDGKNTHLEHLEDNIFNKGYPGAKEAINYLYSLHDMLEGNSTSQVSMTTKWDGAPAIVAGKDPQTGKFFVGTKGVFAKNPKMNFTNSDIEKYHADQGEKDASGLRNKLKLALKHLSKLNWDTVAQGDMLFAGQEDIKEELIDGEQYIVFKPNTIVYAIPKDSDLAKEILSAGFGIVWHTEYVGGPTLADTQAKFGFDASVLGDGSNAGVWQRDATIKDLSGTVTLSDNEGHKMLSAIQEADNYLKTIDANTFSWLQKGTDLVGKTFLEQLKAHANNQVRQGHFDEPTKFAQDFITKFVNYWTKEIDKVKQQKTIDAKTQTMVQGVKFIKENLQSIIAVYDLYLKLIEAKIIIVRKLEQIRQMPTFKQTEKGYEITGEEGFVAVDRLGNALKLVDRLEFSKLNFGSGKPGS
jgi:hypothetical protein